MNLPNTQRRTLLSLISAWLQMLLSATSILEPVSTTNSSISSTILIYAGSSGSSLYSPSPEISISIVKGIDHETVKNLTHLVTPFGNEDEDLSGQHVVLYTKLNETNGVPEIQINCTASHPIEIEIDSKVKIEIEPKVYKRRTWDTDRKSNNSAANNNFLKHLISFNVKLNVSKPANFICSETDPRNDSLEFAYSAVYGFLRDPEKEDSPFAPTIAVEELGCDFSVDRGDTSEIPCISTNPEATPSLYITYKPQIISGRRGRTFWRNKNKETNFTIHGNKLLKYHALKGFVIDNELLLNLTWNEALICVSDSNFMFVLTGDVDFYEYRKSRNHPRVTPSNYGILYSFESPFKNPYNPFSVGLTSTEPVNGTLPVRFTDSHTFVHPVSFYKYRVVFTSNTYGQLTVMCTENITSTVLHTWEVRKPPDHRRHEDLSVFFEQKHTLDELSFFHDAQEGFACARNGQAHLEVWTEPCDNIINCASALRFGSSQSAGDKYQVLTSFRRGSSEAYDLHLFEGTKATGVVICDSPNNQRLSLQYFEGLKPDTMGRIVPLLAENLPPRRYNYLRQFMEGSYFAMNKLSLIEVNVDPWRWNLMYYIGEPLTITCKAAIYLFALPLEIRFQFQNGTQMVAPEVETKVRGNIIISSLTFKINNINLTTIHCFVPLWRSERWMSTTHRSFKNVKITNRAKIEMWPEGNTTIRVQMGETRTLLCNATGTPLPKLTWKKYNQSVTSDTASGLTITKMETEFQVQSMLTIELVNMAHLGTYTCIARSRIDLNERHFEIMFELEEDDGALVLYGLTVALPIVSLIVLMGIIVIWRFYALRKRLRLLTDQERREILEGCPEKAIEYEYLNQQVFWKRFDRKFELQRSDFKFSYKANLGEGEFAVVAQGWLVNPNKDKELAAVKYVRSSAHAKYFKVLACEAKLMAEIGRHVNIIHFHGAFVKNLINRELYLLFEYCENSDLLQLLENSNFTDLVEDDKILNSSEERTRPPKVHNHYYKVAGKNGSRKPAPEISVSTHDLVRFAVSIACGGEYLQAKKVIHGDLAARNVLVTGNLVAKISDFGLSRQLVCKEEYVTENAEKVPWRWMAPEVLAPARRYTLASDIWSFGVLLWEIFTKGDIPYSEYQELTPLFLNELQKPEPPLDFPIYGTSYVYNDVMVKCWKLAPEERPNFSELKLKLESLQVNVTFARSGEIAETRC